MKKALLLAALFVLTFGSGIGQQVFYSGFETWTSTHKPTDWFGVATNVDSLNVNQYTSSTEEGSYAVKLTNTTSGHKRFSTTAVSVTAGQAYNISYYAKGNGSIRSAIYKGATGRYTTYTAYDSINSTNWIKVDQIVISDTTASTAEFVLSFRYTQSASEDLQIDSFCVTLATTPSVPIHDIQYTTDASGNSPYLGQPVKTGGIVSAVKSGAYWIQNGTGPWSGVYVYDSGNSPAIGDSVTFSAIVDEYYNLTELKSVSSYIKVSSGHTVQVTNITIPDGALESYEGVLCKVTNAQCTAMPDTYFEWQIGDGMESLTVGDLIYAYTPVLNTYYDVTGIMDYNFSERKIQPRSAADVTVHNAIDETEISSSVYPNPASDFVTVSAGTEGTLKVVDMTGRVVYSTTFSQSADVNVSEMEPGVYNVMINGNDGEFAISKLIVK